MTRPRSVLAVSRREFLAKSAALVGNIGVPLLVASRALGLNGSVAASDRIVMGGIGIGPRGRTDLACFLRNPDVQFVAVADPQKDRRMLVKEMVDKHYQNSDCQTYHYLFDVLNRDDIDAVLIATGDRWHTMASILAAKAGKDIYCEKPCSMTIAESRALADTISRYGRIYQAGTQRRNIGNFIFAINLVHSGKLGKLHTVHANTLDPRTTREWLPAEPEPPKDVCDWDLWLGPCPWRPFNQRYVNGGWRGFFDFHGGGILEWGSHTVDLCQWANQADDTAPIEYEPQGNHVHATYANGVKLIMRDTGWLGLGTCSVRFEGDEGWVETGDSGQVAVFPESLRSEMPVFTMAGTDPSTHIRDFLDCVKSRKQPASNASVVAQSHIACHAAYIAWQLGRKVRFDPAKEEFIGDEEANRLRSRALREPWHI
ncbi:Gfo/Idh/MocA family protein [Thermogutta sp.]|uniref:Gfo/Idh/MocA family protein n=1 Tax=Thermogutta sp. TaxID=1962930 RepID=UPI00321FFCB0